MALEAKQLGAVCFLPVPGGWTCTLEGVLVLRVEGSSADASTDVAARVPTYVWGVNPGDTIR